MKKVQTLREDLLKAFGKLSKDQLKDLYNEIEKETVKKGLIIYDEKGRLSPINVELMPWFVTQQQKVFFKSASLLIRGALAKLFGLYLNHPPVRKIIPLTEQEEEWFHEICPLRPQAPQTVFERLDVNACFWHEDWRTNFKLMEANSVAVGGIHYIPAAIELAEEQVLPQIKKHLPGLKLSKLDDIRSLVLANMQEHCRKLGRKLKTVVFIEDRSYQEGTAEMDNIAEFFKKAGINAIVSDPRHLHIGKGVVCVDDTPVDIVYRDCELEELLMMEQEGDSIDAIRQAFAENRVISGFSGDFDHKSALEVFTSSEFLRFFTPRERAFFKKHIAWTRLIWPRRTKDKTGKQIDLIKYIRTNQSDLVLKPNRECGGEGVVLGRAVPNPKWQKTLDKAAKKPGTMVVQEAVRIDKDKIPFIGKDATLRFKERYVVSGFAATPAGIAFLGRSSKDEVVNVSRGGGLIAAFLAK